MKTVALSLVVGLAITLVSYGFTVPIRLGAATDPPDQVVADARGLPWTYAFTMRAELEGEGLEGLVEDTFMAGRPRIGDRFFVTRFLVSWGCWIVVSALIIVAMAVAARASVRRRTQAATSHRV